MLLQGLLLCPLQQVDCYRLIGDGRAHIIPVAPLCDVLDLAQVEACEALNVKGCIKAHLEQVCCLRILKRVAVEIEIKGVRCFTGAENASSKAKLSGKITAREII